jgi:hypothetical protein
MIDINKLNHLQISEIHKLEKIKLQNRLLNEYPYATRKQIKNSFNNDDDIVKYDSERAYLKKQIQSITQKIKYNENEQFRLKNNNDIKLRREIKKKNKTLITDIKDIEDDKIELEDLNKKIIEKIDILKKDVYDLSKDNFNLNNKNNDLEYKILC